MEFGPTFCFPDAREETDDVQFYRNDENPTRSLDNGKPIGQKPPLKLGEIWTVCTQLRAGENSRDLALFNLANDSKLRSCNLVALHVRNAAHSDQELSRSSVVQHKTGVPIRLEWTE